MRAAFAVLAGLTGLAAAKPVAERRDVTCSESYSGSFEIEVVNATSSRRAKRDTALILTLSDGILTDSYGRQGYIASNYQFQFNTPVQTNAIADSGFEVCSNGSLALDGNAIWYECLSGTFYNLYDDDIAAQCTEAYIEVIPYSSSSSTSATAAASVATDGQVTASPVSTTAVTAVCEYTDGQPQEDCSTSTSSSSTSSVTAVCEYTDGQPQEDCSTSTSAETTSSVVAATTTAANVTTASLTSTTAAATSASYTGAAATMVGASFGGVAAFGLALLAL